MIGMHASLLTLLPAAAGTIMSVDTAALGLSTATGQSDIVSVEANPNFCPLDLDKTVASRHPYQRFSDSPPIQIYPDDFAVDHTVDYAVDLEPLHRRADLAGPVDTSAVMYAMPTSLSRLEYSDEIIKKLMSGIPKKGSGWPREGFLERLQTVNWNELFLGIGDIPQEIWLAGVLASQIRCLGLSREGDKGKQYFQIHLRLEKVGGTVKVRVMGYKQGVNTKAVLVALYQNQGLSWEKTRTENPGLYQEIQSLANEALQRVELRTKAKQAGQKGRIDRGEPKPREPEHFMVVRRPNYLVEVVSEKVLSRNGLIDFLSKYFGLSNETVTVWADRAFKHYEGNDYCVLSEEFGMQGARIRFGQVAYLPSTLPGHGGRWQSNIYTVRRTGNPGEPQAVGLEIIETETIERACGALVSCGGVL